MKINLIFIFLLLSFSFSFAQKPELIVQMGHAGPIESISFSPDGKYIASAGLLDGLIKLWDILTGKEIKTFVGHVDNVNSIIINSVEKYIVSSSDDGTIKSLDIQTGREITTINVRSYYHNFSFRLDGKYIVDKGENCKIKIWDTFSRKEIACLMALDINDWVIATPENYYTCSKGGYNGVAFCIGNQVYPFEQFDLKYNRPDIVLKRIGYASKELIDSYHNAYLKRLKKMKFDTTMFNKDFHLPEMKLLTEDIPLSTDKKKLKFKVNAKDSKYLLDRINVYNNGVALFGTEGINLRDKKISDIDQEIEMELVQGNNKVQVSVLNDKGVESLMETIEINYDGEIKKPDLYLIAIGASKYKDSRFNLDYAARDAKDIAALFESNRSMYGDIYKKELLNEQVTKEKIKELKSSFLQKSKPDDIVIIYYSGHGLLNNNLDYYLATYDIDFDKPEEKGLAYDEMENLLDGLPALKKLLFMDACHSGELDIDEIEVNKKINEKVKELALVSRGARSKKGFGLNKTNELVEILFADIRKGTGATVISSAGGAEFAYEGEKWKNGLFTYCVINGLSNKAADLNHDGKIMLSELQKYVQDEVNRLSNGK